MRAVLAAGLLLAGALSAHASDRLAAAVVAARDAVQSTAGITSAPPVAAERCAAETTALIVRWEIGSPARYTRLYQRPICPLCESTVSGPTVGIGADLGHTTRPDIRRDWRAHPQVQRLETGSGYTGRAAIPVTAAMQDVVTPYRLAEQVFIEASLPSYAAATRRAYGQAVEQLPCGALSALRSVTYNRGGAMAGDRNREKRVIRDVCIPAGDVQCIANQILSMRRLWPGSSGLQDRRVDEARVTLQ